MNVNEAKLGAVAQKLWAEVYESPFRGKERGRFCLSREQLRQALGVQRLHASTIERLQDVAIGLGLVVIDLDDLFPCIEIRIVRRYRKPPSEIFARFFPADEDEVTSEAEDEE